MSLAARECNLIDPSAHCFVPHFAEGGPLNPLSRLQWESVDNPIFKLDERTLKPLAPPAESDTSLPYDLSNLRNYTVAVSGDAFRWIIDFASEDVLREVSLSMTSTTYLLTVVDACLRTSLRTNVP